MNVQAIINNISFPKTIDGLEWFIKEHSCFNVEDILYDKTVEWTVPQWALPGDIVFFFHANRHAAASRQHKSAMKNLEECPLLGILPREMDLPCVYACKS